MMRTYVLPTTANRHKLDEMVDLLPMWQRGLVHVQYMQVRRLKAGESNLGWLGGEVAKSLPSYLSQRQWKSVVNQVNAALDAWRAAAVVGVRDLIRGLEIGDDMRVLLYRINIRRAWWMSQLILDVKTGIEVPQGALHIARDLIGRWLSRNRFPNLSRVCSMAMDGPIAGVEVADGLHADYWVRITTSRAGSPVRIPLHSYEYFDVAPGVVRNFCLVSVSPDGVVTFALVKKSLDADLRCGGEKVGVDWGMASMFTTSSGQILGRALFPWLVERDTEITVLASSLQRQGIKVSSSKRYRALNRRIRGYVRNEVGRLLNQIAEQDIREIVVEKLDFRHSRLSRVLNRIVSRAGRAAVTAKLASLHEVSGIAVTEVNPAYTSRRCTGCGYVDPKNRTSQKRFVCRFCGKKLLADINAARNVLGRSEVQGGGLSMPRDRVLAELDRRFTAAWQCDPTRLRERPTRRGRSTATSPLAESIAAEEPSEATNTVVVPVGIRASSTGGYSAT